MLHVVNSVCESGNIPMDSLDSKIEDIKIPCVAFKNL